MIQTASFELIIEEVMIFEPFMSKAVVLTQEYHKGFWNRKIYPKELTTLIPICFFLKEVL